MTAPETGRTRREEATRSREEALRYLRDFEALISTLATRFIGVPSGDLDRRLEEALEQIARFVGTPTGHVFAFSPDGTRFSMTHLWLSEDGPATRREDLQGLDATAMPWWMDQLRSGHPVAVDEVQALPAAAAQEKAIIELHGIRALIDIPLQVDGRVTGFVGFSMLQPRRWTPDEVALLELAARMIANALQRRRAEERILEARDAAEAANRAKGAFLANMSHELRTPLTAVLGFAELLHDDAGLGPGPRANAARILEQGQQLLELLDGLLALSQVEGDRLQLQAAPVDLRALLGSLARLFRRQATRRGLTLRFQCADDVPAWVQADAVRLRQLVAGLLDNAVRFTERGGVTLRVASERRGERSLVRVEVEDTGPGMSPDVLQRAFAPFERAGASSQRGVGLGLALGRRVARLMEGDLVGESAPGRGSVLRLEVLLAESAPDAGRRASTRRHPAPALPSQETLKAALAETASAAELVALRQAVTEGDVEQLLTLIGPLEQRAPVLAAMRRLVERFALDALDEVVAAAARRSR